MSALPFREAILGLRRHVNVACVAVNSAGGKGMNVKSIRVPEEIERVLTLREAAGPLNLTLAETIGLFGENGGKGKHQR